MASVVAGASCRSTQLNCARRLSPSVEAVERAGLEICGGVGHRTIDVAIAKGLEDFKSSKATPFASVFAVPTKLDVIEFTVEFVVVAIRFDTVEATVTTGFTRSHDEDDGGLGFTTS